MYDLVIVGGGIAGMTAAIFAARRELKCLLISNNLGGQMINTLEIENWPGEDYITGSELAKKVQQQMDKYHVELKYSTFNAVSKNGDNFVIEAGEEKIESKTVILAYGKSPSRLNVPGERELEGRGVSYCVNCDGQFFRGKTVAVVGGGNSALEAAISMSEISQKVYLMHRKDVFRGEDVLINKAKGIKNIEIIMEDEIAEIFGTNKVEKIVTKKGQVIALDGVFIEIGHVADTSMVRGLLDLDNMNQIVVNESQATSVDGIFSAGDITNYPFKQLVIAAGQGASAALAAVRYIQTRR